MFAVADGIKIYLEKAVALLIQNIYNNGWQHDHFEKNALFLPQVANHPRRIERTGLHALVCNFRMRKRVKES